MLIINEIYHFFLKSSRYYNNIVTPYFLGVTNYERSRNFDKLIKEGTESGTIIVTENKIVTDKTFDL